MLRGAAASAEAARHAAQCHECAVRLERERLLDAGLAMAAEEARAAAPPPEIEEALGAAFRSRRRVARRLWPRSVWSGAAAAAAAVLYLLVRADGPGPTPPPEPVRTEEPAVVASAAAPAPSRRTAAPAGPKIRRAAVRNAPTAATRPAPRRSAEGPGEDNGFILLRQPPALPDEDLRLIRIRLPRREMRRFGVPVSAEWESWPVQADVVLGDDGSARAVRFVR